MAIRGRRLHVAQHNNRGKSRGEEARAVVAILQQIVAPVDRFEEKKCVSHPAQLLYGSRTSKWKLQICRVTMETLSLIVSKGCIVFSSKWSIFRIVDIPE